MSETNEANALAGEVTVFADRLESLALGWTAHSCQVSKFIDSDHADEIAQIVAEMRAWGRTAVSEPTTDEGVSIQ